VRQSSSDRRVNRTDAAAAAAGAGTEPDRAGTAVPQGRAGGAVGTDRKKLSFKERRELELLPDRIAALEEEQRRLQAEAASPEFYRSAADRIRTVLARIDAIVPELEAVLARWVELGDRES
jgi:ATP-binding cassette subfamily F protein uup